MKITQIFPQTKDPLRENIYLDGKFGFGLAAEARFENRLKVGQEISETEVRELVLGDQVRKLFASAERFLSFRPRSEFEVRQNLKRKLDRGEWVDADLILNSVLKKLSKLKLVDDREFTRWWIDQRQKFKPRGEMLLRSELHGKGIPREIIDEALRAYEAPDSEIDRVAAKVVSRYSKLPRAEFRNKLGTYLARRGYSWDEISPVVDRLLRSV